MIYTCIADGIRSPPAFFLKNKYKEPMKMQNENTKRVWLYARIPGNDGETLRCIRECAAKAQQDNCKIVGTSADERYGWLLRPGYREMMRQVNLYLPYAPDQRQGTTPIPLFPTGHAAWRQGRNAGIQSARQTA